MGTNLPWALGKVLKNKDYGTIVNILPKQGMFKTKDTHFTNEFIPSGKNRQSFEVIDYKISIYQCRFCIPVFYWQEPPCLYSV